MYEIVAFTKDKHVARRIRYDDYVADPRSHWPVLATAERVAYCTCAEPAPRLQNRRWPGTAGGFQLARWPYSGGEHSADCGFFKYSLADEGCARRIAAIRILANGAFDITPDFELERPRSAPPTWDFERWCSRARSQADMPRCGRTSLLGLLEFLLMTAKLNEYSPGEARDWREVRRRLTGRVAYGQLNKKPLGGRVVVMPTFHDTGRLRSVAAEFGPTRTGSQRFLILGDPKGYIDRRDTRLQIGAGGPSLIVGSEVRDRLRDRFPIASAALERQRDAVLGLFLVEVQGVSGDILKRIRVIDGALTLLSWPSLVPVDSHHEALVANRLVDAERSFLKPMVIDSLLRMLPDFVLRDKVSREYVEVWGMDGEAYRERMEEKIARYDELNLKLIDWHAYRKEPMPDFGATATGTFSRQNATANQVLRRKKTRAERYPG